MNARTRGATPRSVFILVTVLATFFYFSAPAQAEWFFGIGTGFTFMNVDGTQGFNTELLGPVEYDIKLDPKDFRDFTKSAFGFGGYATSGTWMIQYSYARLELEDETDAYVPAFDTTTSTKINFTMTGAELTVGYPVYRARHLVILVDGGVRYTKHEFDGRIIASGAVSGRRDREFDHSWTDAVVGASLNVPFTEKWSWNNRLNAGFGGSEGTYFASTGLSWRFLKHWSTGLTGTYKKVKFENDSKGDSDWYLYDVDESTVGLNVLFNW